MAITGGLDPDIVQKLREQMANDIARAYPSTGTVTGNVFFRVPETDEEYLDKLNKYSLDHQAEMEGRTAVGFDGAGVPF